ncbi:MAG TPA: hypothetical protein VGX23_25570 [Actinocrinis sp.]|nr:hypothetical protein [Actinocrinis sp.]
MHNPQFTRQFTRDFPVPDSTEITDFAGLAVDQGWAAAARSLTLDGSAQASPSSADVGQILQ